MNIAQLCPVCVGKGKVPPGFYDRNPTAGLTVGSPLCQSCLGAGYVTTQQQITYYHPPITIQPLAHKAISQMVDELAGQLVHCPYPNLRGELERLAEMLGQTIAFVEEEEDE